MSQNHTDLLTVIQLAASKVPAGEVLFTSGEKSGRIFIQGGRVRWAFAKGQDKSFQNILHEDKNLDKQSIVEAVKSSRENGSLDLDDVLVRLGLDKELERSEVILEHTRSAIEELASWPKSKVKIRPSSKKVDKTKSSFSLKEIFPEGGVQIFSDFEIYFDELFASIPGALVISIIDSQSGTPIAFKSTEKGASIDTASAFYRDVAKAGHDALIALDKAKPKSNPIQEILLTGRSESVVIRVLNSGEQLVYLMLEPDANPGVALLQLRDRLTKIERTLEDRLNCEIEQTQEGEEPAQQN